jgi:hypothetical protein
MAVVAGVIDRRSSGNWPIYTMVVNVLLASFVPCVLLPHKFAARVFRMLNTMSVLPAGL